MYVSLAHICVSGYDTLFISAMGFWSEWENWLVAMWAKGEAKKMRQEEAEGT